MVESSAKRHRIKAIAFRANDKLDCSQWPRKGDFIAVRYANALTALLERAVEGLLPGNSVECASWQADRWCGGG
jgi:hypothetical protein